MLSIGLLELLLLITFSLALGVSAAVWLKKKGAGLLIVFVSGAVVSILAIPLIALLALLVIELRK